MKNYTWSFVLWCCCVYAYVIEYMKSEDNFQEFLSFNHGFWGARVGLRTSGLHSKLLLTKAQSPLFAYLLGNLFVCLFV